ncbi:MAG TPA: hypothetical protein VIJ77_07385 [Candidatus Tumulicola sp.]
MNGLERTCGGTILALWGGYALVVLVIDRVVSAHGLPAGLAWTAGLVIGLTLLVATREM